MSDNPESIDLLEGYRASLNTGRTLYIAAGISALAGIISFWAETTTADFAKSPNFGPGYALLGIGLGLGVGGFTLQNSASRKLERAVDNYNR